MKNILIYPVGGTPACRAAASFLEKLQIPITDHVTPEATHLLMDVPTFSKDGLLKNGARLEELLTALPKEITLIGGKLPPEAMAGHPYIDLLEDEQYLYENAAITAECALRAAAEKASFSFRGAPVLIVGWGRIGKHLAKLLSCCRAEVSVLSTSEKHLAEISSFGLCPISVRALPLKIGSYRLLFNTAPGLMIPEALSAQARNCLKFDLASVPGIMGDDVIWARGLPGIYAPDSAGRLIAGTVLRLLREGKA